MAELQQTPGPTVRARARRPTPEEAQLLTVYQDAEQALLRSVTNQVRDVVDATDDRTDAARLAGAHQVAETARRVIGGLERGGPARVAAVLGAAREQGAAAAAAELGGITGRGRDQYSDTINRGALDRLAATVLDRLTPAHAAILRTTLDAFREITARVLPAALVGADTRRAATQRALWQFTDRGITGMTDKAGRRWSLSAYAEMAVRTGAARAATDGRLDRIASAGLDLVIVNSSGDRCPLCRAWSGKVLTIGGSGARTVQVQHTTRDDQMVTARVAGSVDDARRAGLLHPQCRCSLAAYLPGVTRPPPPADDDGQYEARQRQRAIERQIRAWKAREQAALSPAELRYARAGRLAAGERMKQHMADNPDLLRRRYREQIGTGNQPTRRTAGRLTDPVKGRERAPRDMTNDELDHEIQAALAAEDFDRFERLADETDRRDAAKVTARERRAKAAAERDEQRAAEMERLVDGGLDEEEAVERVYGKSVEKQRREAAIAQLRADGYRGKGFDELSRDSYKDRAYSRYQEAEDATNGYMVNAEGKRKGVSEAQFFTTSDDEFVRKYASRELQEWFDQNGRPTLAEHRAELLGDHQAANRLRNERGDVYQ